MKPIDFRNETFFSLQGWIAGSRAAVLEAWRLHGPCTTKQLADRSGLDLLSLRPRTTELEQLGYVCLADAQESAGEGTYRVRSEVERQTWTDRQIAEARNLQRELNFK